ncbi:MAG: hypothetical protein HQ486_08360 [Acidimicrobiaceae bacterium]|nr:hypothetical protein [Acidimicrobiaceae bacterium]
MKQYLGVLHKFSEGPYPEPGIKRAPTLEDQKKALNIFLRNCNGQLLKELVLDDELITSQSGFDNIVRNSMSDGIIFFSIESLRKANALIDIKLLGRLHKTFDNIFMILESISITSRFEFEAIASRIIVNNECAQRDSSENWRHLIQKLAVSLDTK